MCHGHKVEWVWYGKVWYGMVICPSIESKHIMGTWIAMKNGWRSPPISAFFKKSTLVSTVAQMQILDDFGDEI